VPVEPSRAASRAGQLLNVLSTEPTRNWSLAELARAIDVHRSSCQTLLLALCGEGLVSRREPGATYRLGPGLIALGHAALAAVDAIDLSDRHVDRLHREFGCSGLVGTVAGDSVVVAVAHAEPSGLGYSATAGARLPLRAPAAPVYVAWSHPSTVEGWLDRADPPLDPRRREALRDDLATVRRRGWSATVRATGAQGSAAVTHEATDDDLARRRLSVVGVSAPVWNGHGDLVCSLALAVLPTEVTGARLVQIGSAVRDAAADVTGSLKGRAPEP
jgi:DNA-binding IclR family transcriptional regulator